MNNPTYSPKTLVFDVQGGTLGILTLELHLTSDDSLVAAVNATDHYTTTPNPDGTQHIVADIVGLNLTPTTVSSIPVNTNLTFKVQDVRGSSVSPVGVQASPFQFQYDLMVPKNISVA